MTTRPGARPSAGMIFLWIVIIAAAVLLGAWVVLNANAIIQSFWPPTPASSQGHAIHDLTNTSMCRVRRPGVPVVAGVEVDLCQALRQGIVRREGTKLQAGDAHHHHEPDEQRLREADLRNDEDTLEPGAGRRPAAGVLECIGHVDPRGVQGRRKTEDDSRT